MTVVKIVQYSSKYLLLSLNTFMVSVGIMLAPSLASLNHGLRSQLYDHVLCVVLSMPVELIALWYINEVTLLVA